MQEEEIRGLFKSPAGYLGPIGIEWAKDHEGFGEADPAGRQGTGRAANLIGGANKENYHVKNLTPGKNFHPTAYVDLRGRDRGRGLSELRRGAAHGYGG